MFQKRRQIDRLGNNNQQKMNKQTKTRLRALIIAITMYLLYKTVPKLRDLFHFAIQPLVGGLNMIENDPMLFMEHCCK